MLQMPVPTVLVGDLLRGELATAGLSTAVFVVDTTLVLRDLDEGQRGQAAAVVQAHAATAQAFLNQAAAERANESTIQQRATSALAANATYIGRAAPTAAQNTAQIKALSQQMNGLIRLVLRRFDGTD